MKLLPRQRYKKTLKNVNAEASSLCHRCSQQTIMESSNQRNDFVKSKTAAYGKKENKKKFTKKKILDALVNNCYLTGGSPIVSWGGLIKSNLVPTWNYYHLVTYFTEM